MGIYIGEFNFRPDQEAYVKLINTTGKVIRSDAVKFERIGDYEVPPEIKNLEIKGSLAPGEKLIGSYEYLDINGDEEKGTQIRWFRGNDINSNEWEEIKNSSIEADPDITYTLQLDDVGKYIKLVVEPKNDKETGLSVSKIVGPVASSKKAPVASDLIIEGKPWKHYTLKATYKYKDDNFDLEDGSEYAWYYADDKNSENWNKIVSGTTTASEGMEFTIGDEYIGKYIRCSIIPKNKQDNGVGSEVFSNIIGPIKSVIVKPTIENIRFTGQMVLAEDIFGAAVGGKIEIKGYDYKHELNYKEDKTKVKYQWYKSNTLTGNFEKIEGATSDSFVVTDELAGKYIKVGIIVASEDGQMSEEVFSKIIPVRWKLAFYDEFDYIAKDGRDPKFTEKWISQAGPRILGNPEIKSARIPENVEVDGEYLIIHNRKETNPNYPFEHTWTTGNVYTEPIAKFGYYECSYKLAEATGLNQSFWLMTASPLEHGKFVEVDFNEGH